MRDTRLSAPITEWYAAFPELSSEDVHSAVARAAIILGIYAEILAKWNIIGEPVFWIGSEGYLRIYAVLPCPMNSGDVVFWNARGEPFDSARTLPSAVVLQLSAMVANRRQEA
jgi:hypothetical protein